jgi:hypothetical protein
MVLLVLRTTVGVLLTYSYGCYSLISGGATLSITTLLATFVAQT